DLVWSHGACSARHERDVYPHADTALCPNFADRARKSRGAEVLHRLARVGLDQFEGGFEQELLKERVAHLDRRALGVGTGAELERGQERGARDSVAARVAPHEVHRTARSRTACLAEVCGTCE